MNKTHRKTLEMIFQQPAPVSLEWRKIESLFQAIGAKIIEGAGSRVRFEFSGVIGTFHRPHPKKEASLIKFVMPENFLRKWGCCHERNEL